MSDNTLLEVQNLVIEYPVKGGQIRAVDNVSLTLENGDALGLVGESGCGKSTLGFSILNQLKGGQVKSGQVLFQQQNLILLSENEIRGLRGNEISMIFQASQNVLNPLQTVQKHFEDTLLAHSSEEVEEISEDKQKNKSNPILQYFVDTFSSLFNGKKKKISDEEWKDVLTLLSQLEIAENRLKDYPFQFSGGMQQRIVIALALLLKPKLLIADEPTTALDVLVQARILDLLKELKKQFQLTMIFISHDLGVVAEVTNKMAIMYAGQIVEFGDTRSIFTNPKHPYTEALLEAIPEVKDEDRKIQKSIPGSPPNLKNKIIGCRFAPRCKYVMDTCKSISPELLILDNNENYKVRCFKYHE